MASVVVVMTLSWMLGKYKSFCLKISSILFKYFATLLLSSKNPKEWDVSNWIMWKKFEKIFKSEIQGFIWRIFRSITKHNSVTLSAKNWSSFLQTCNFKDTVSNPSHPVTKIQYYQFQIIRDGLLEASHKQWKFLRITFAYLGQVCV